VLRFGGWLQATSLLILAQSQLDKILLGGFVALAPVGEYELGWRGAFAVTLPPFFFLGALLPALARRESGADDASRRALYGRVMDPYFLLVVLFAAGTFALAPDLLEAWLRTPPPHATFMLRAIIVAQVGSLLTGVASTMARALERAELETRYVAVAFALHVVLSGAGLALFGWRGVPIGFAVSSMIAAVWFIARIERLIGLPALRGTARALGPALLAGVVAGALGLLAVRLLPGSPAGRAHGLLASACGGAVYAAAFGALLTFVWRERGRAMWRLVQHVAHP
jgi:O-antigen/teichoic acid export membrane protein